jgi:hypothetical protein
MNDELKPCPFCGGEMVLTHDHTTEDIDRIWHAVPQINCPISGASGFSIGNDQLVEAWNARADDPELTRLRARVAELEEGIWASVEAEAKSLWENEPISGSRVYHGCEWDELTERRRNTLRIEALDIFRMRAAINPKGQP